MTKKAHSGGGVDVIEFGIDAPRVQAGALLIHARPVANLCSESFLLERNSGFAQFVW